MAWGLYDTLACITLCGTSIHLALCWAAKRQREKLCTDRQRTKRSWQASRNNTPRQGTESSVIKGLWLWDRVLYDSYSGYVHYFQGQSYRGNHALCLLDACKVLYELSGLYWSVRVNDCKSYD